MEPSAGFGTSQLFLTDSRLGIAVAQEEQVGCAIADTDLAIAGRA